MLFKAPMELLWVREEFSHTIDDGTNDLMNLAGFAGIGAGEASSHCRERILA